MDFVFPAGECGLECDQDVKRMNLMVLCWYFDKFLGYLATEFEGLRMTFRVAPKLGKGSAVRML